MNGGFGAIDGHTNSSPTQLDPLKIMKTATLPPPRLRHNLTVVFAVLLLVSLVAPARAQVQSVPTIDSTFQAHEGARAPIAFQADGKIMVTGVSFLANGVAQQGIARLQANGTLDTTFTPGSGAVPNDIAAIVVLPDQKILVAGTFTSFNNRPVAGVVRLAANGAYDSSFNYDGPADVTRVVVSRSGDLLISTRNSQKVRRHAPDGATRHVLPLPLETIPASTEPPPPYSPSYVARFAAGDVKLADFAVLEDGAVLIAYAVLDNRGTAWPGATWRDDGVYVKIYAYTDQGALANSAAIIDVIPETGLHHNDFDIFMTKTRIVVAESGDYYVIGDYSNARYQKPPIVARYQANGLKDVTFNPPEAIPPYIGEMDFRSYHEGAVDSLGRLVCSGILYKDPSNSAITGNHGCPVMSS